MAKFAGFVVAQIVSAALALVVAYAMNSIDLLHFPPVIGSALSWPILIAWGLILLFVSPALSRFFSRLFGAESDGAQPRKSK